MSTTKSTLYKDKGDNAHEHYTLFTSINSIPLPTKGRVNLLSENT